MLLVPFWYQLLFTFFRLVSFIHFVLLIFATFVWRITITSDYVEIFFLKGPSTSFLIFLQWLVRQEFIKFRFKSLPSWRYRFAGDWVTSRSGLWWWFFNRPSIFANQYLFFYGLLDGFILTRLLWRIRTVLSLIKLIPFALKRGLDDIPETIL